ncbi:hypothetical protein [Alkalihalobacterium sp. APHAB7]|uniref:hypothetical protein n=1 Tax=Alkalihalobacterium sp. APHAB7 TaxID=3402081 RepID=UPI003AAC2DDA
MRRSSVIFYFVFLMTCFFSFQLYRSISNAYTPIDGLANLLSLFILFILVIASLLFSMKFTEFLSSK